MRWPAATGSAASAATGVKPSPSSARRSSSGARSLAMPTTCAPAACSATAMPRPKPRLAPVTMAVVPDRFFADMESSSVRCRFTGTDPGGDANSPVSFLAAGDLKRYVSGLRAPHGPVPARIARALLPDGRLGARRRGPGAGDPRPRLAGVGRLRGPLVGADLAVSHLHERVPAGAGEPGAAAAAVRPWRAGRPGRAAGCRAA